MRKVADILHKTAVTGLMAFTVFAGATLGYQVYQYISYVRPEHLKQIKSEEQALADQ